MKKLHSIFCTPYVSIIFFMMISCHTIKAQVEKNTLLASQYFKKADSLLTDRKLDSSVVYFEKALKIYQKSESWEKVAACYNGTSETQRHQNKYKESFYNAKKALQISTTYFQKKNQEVAKALDNIGEYYIIMVDVDKALSNFKNALLIRQEIFLENNSDISKSYNNIGKALVKSNELSKALDYFNEAINPIFQNNPHLPDIYSNIAQVYYIISRYDKAMDYIQKAIKLEIAKYGEVHPKIAKYYTNLGILFENTGKYDEALHYYIKGLKIQTEVLGENNLNVAVSYENIASLFGKKEDFENVIDYMQKATAIREKILGENNVDLWLNYNNIGSSYINNGLYNKALIYVKKSIAFQNKIFKKDHLKTTSTLNNLSLIYLAKKEYVEALAMQEKVLKIMISSFGENNEQVAKTYKIIGVIYADQQMWEKALFYYNKSASILIKTMGENHISLLAVYLNISTSYKKKKEYKKALEYSQKALRLCQNNHILTTKMRNSIASIYLEKKEYQNALQNYQKALQSNSKFHEEFISEVSLKIDNYLDKKSLLTSITGQAKTYQKLYLQDKNSGYLTNAIQKHHLADTLIQTIRQSFTNYQDKVTFAKQAKEIYQEAIETVLLQKNSQSLEQAFYYAEKSKANTLKELLNDAGAKNYSGLPANMVALEKELRINRSFYQSKITEELSNKEVDTSKIRDFENELFITDRRQDSLTEILEKNYPKYYQLKYRNDIVSITDIQQKLDDKTTVVSFFTGDSVTYAFTVSKNDISVQQLSTPKLTEQIEEFRNSIIAKDIQKHKKQAYALYTKLIAPIQDKLVGEELIIIPDGPLWHLNFEVLISKKDDSNNPALLSYLLKDYAISYANSATLLFTPFKDVAKSKTLQECLAFSFSDSTNIAQANTMRLAALRDTGDDLPGTRKEIKAISNIIDGEYYYGSRAIESNFKKNAGKYNILHLALHGDVDNERPENSKLYFTKSKDTLEDNLLYSHELFALDIPAELTVLSACNTGSGKIAKGEGIMSLGTAFQYAGTKSLLLTSWEVSDQTTPKVMKYFYTNLKAGMNKAKALQQAKLQYLTTANINRADPFYWGAFYLVGDSAPIPFESNTLLYWIIGALTLVLLVGLLWYRRKIRNKN